MNIYGSEFTKGEKGKNTFANQEKKLGLKIAASFNTTIINVDWKLREGDTVSKIFKNTCGCNLQDVRRHRCR